MAQALQPVQVTTTYLHIPTRAEFRPALLDPAAAQQQGVQVQQAHEPLPAFYRFLYNTVGADYYWLARAGWSDDELARYLAQPTVALLVLYVRGTPVGFIELNASSDEPGTEIAYFGLIGAFHGRGLGKHLLSVGVQRAFDEGTQRIWLHTCTLDGPYALRNYQARGFQPYRSSTATMYLPAP
jgi:ribosomal protein S18 acetylase RimI-like enzyme